MAYKEDLKRLMDARAEAREKVAKIYPYDMKGNIVCHMNQISFDNKLSNLAIISRSDHAKLCSLLRSHKIPKGKESKRFALRLRSIGEIDMIYPLSKKNSICIEGFVLP